MKQGSEIPPLRARASQRRPQAPNPPETSADHLRDPRLLDFASIKELTAQTGHGPGDWPLVILKEGFDNALDAAEEAGIAAAISVMVEKNGVTIRDNGPGIPATTIERLLDFAVRVSSREAYVSPTRGAQGNAFKTILAMPFVLDEEKGKVEIAAHGERHRSSSGWTASGKSRSSTR